MSCVKLFASLIIVCATSVAFAADGVPSQDRLSKLGLSSMDIVNDEQGEEVRGKAFGTLTLAIPIVDAGGGTVSLVGLATSNFGNGAAIVGAGTGPINRFGSVGTASVFLDPATGLVDTVVDSGAFTITVPVISGGAVATVNVTVAGTIFAGGQ